ncbi:MAG: DedA family protein [Parachlamydiaceae bacterium]|nr:DedA family protein [Parachlamydiaceae bacterium]
MDSLINNETLSLWLLNYGSFTLFVLLTLGIIILPIPEETLLVLSGTLIASGKLNLPATIIAACAGSICGISLSYILGKTVGTFFITKYGYWLGIREHHLQKAHNWFEHYGKWTLFFGYFIPGIRHFTGVSAGITNLELQEFFLYAYTGAVIWVATFLSIGYFFGEYWLSIIQKIEIGVEEAGAIIVIAIICYLLYSFRKKIF